MDGWMNTLPYKIIDERVDSDGSCNWTDGWLQLDCNWNLVRRLLGTVLIKVSIFTRVQYISTFMYLLVPVCQVMHSSWFQLY